MEGETIFVALVDHKHGLNAYVGRTEESVYAQLAEYCREYWAEEVRVWDEEKKTWGTEPPPMPDADEDLVMAYFEDLDHESYSVSEATLPAADAHKVTVPIIWQALALGVLKENDQLGQRWGSALDLAKRVMDAANETKEGK